MAQYDFGTIDPNTKSGTALATDLNSYRNAVNSMHSGSSAPSYITAGMMWVDTTSADYEVKLYDGAQSITVAIIDATNNVARVAVDPAETSYITSTTSAQIRHVIASTNIFTTRSTGIQFNLDSPVIADSNNNELISFTTTASAVNQLNVANSATGGSVNLSAVGTDTNISIALTPKGTGGVGIGTATPSSALDVVGAITATAALSITGADSTASQVILQSYRSGSGVQTGGIVRIRSLGDGTGDAVQIIFDTNSTEAMRIDPSQNLLIGSTNNNPAVDNVQGIACGGTGIFSANCAATSHRIGKTADGAVVTFYSAGDAEGNISISGTTTSYNGGHLARWSQTADNTRIAGLLKGTVLTNLDQMAVWASQANEQLNCMAVSTVEGDPNVAGVFVNWDDDDEVFTTDMNVAMTGDMVIRIAAGTTVQRGDLLMSAGDGTAKPQGDDIVRSKTIAKVTSTHVSETYADGSYVVPCVLMAC
jgi:hypothetical protein